MQYFFNKVHLQGILLRDDNSSMSGSVELRVPFLDHKIVEFAAQIPDKYKKKWKKNSKKIRMCMISDSISENYDISKYILRKSFDKILPTKIINRKKIGFPVPTHDFLKSKLRLC